MSELGRSAIIGQGALEGSLAALRSEQMTRLGRGDARQLRQEFEAILLAQAIKAMRDTIPRSGLLPSSAYHGVYDGLFDLELARSIVKRGGLGLEIDGSQASAGRTVTRIEEGSFAPPAKNVSRQGAPARPTLSQPAQPVSGTVTSGFGYRIDPIDGERRFHAGLDIAAPLGSAIRAVAKGEVVFSGWRPGSGLTAVIAHGAGVTTIYGHAQALAVQAGQKVAAGQVIARVGESGRTTGPHLHFQLKIAGQPVDPEGVLTIA